LKKRSKHDVHYRIIASTGLSEECSRNLYLERVNADYVALKANPKSYAKFKKEMSEWDISNLDGLKKL
jgi:hypothetical protein